MRVPAMTSVAVLILASSPTTAAEPMDALVGQWTSPDGFAKQSIERQLDGSWLSTRMWFWLDDKWKLVGTGSIYRNPKVEYWSVVSRTTDMDGIELFESRLLPKKDGRFELDNLAVKGDGSVIVTHEEWHFADADHYKYMIYQVSGEERTPWLAGSWVRSAEDK